MSATSDNPRFTKPSEMPETIELGGVLYELHSLSENYGKEGGPPEYIDFRYYWISENKKYPKPSPTGSAAASQGMTNR